MSITHTTDEELRLQRRVRELEAVLKAVHDQSILRSKSTDPSLMIAWWGFDIGVIAALTKPYAQEFEDEEPT